MKWFRKADKADKTPTARVAKLADADVAGAVEGFRRFRQQFSADRAFYQKLAEEQRPNLLWIGCSDSRVVPDILTNSDPGRLFVVRNIANIIPPANAADTSVGAAVDYAISHLGIDDIVICGHTGCGGVNAIQNGLPGPETHLHRWLKPVSIPRNLTPLDAVKHNVLAQRDNLLTYRVVQDRVSAGTLNIHEWLYDMGEGEIWAYDGETDRWRSLGDSDH